MLLRGLYTLTPQTEIGKVLSQINSKGKFFGIVANLWLKMSVRPYIKPLIQEDFFRPHSSHIWASIIQGYKRQKCKNVEMRFSLTLIKIDDRIFSLHIPLIHEHLFYRYFVCWSECLQKAQMQKFRNAIFSPPLIKIGDWYFSV